MKKFLLLVVLLTFTLVMSGCDLREDDWDVYECGAGDVWRDGQCVTDTDYIPPTDNPVCVLPEVLVLGACELPEEDPIDVVDYSFDISGLPEYITSQAGEPSFNHISEWFETDYDFDGDYTDIELELSNLEMLEYFDEDHIVILSDVDIAGMDWCIDENMSDEYINAAIYAIEYYDGIEWFTATWTMESDCSSADFSFSWTSQLDLYIELYESYTYEDEWCLVEEEEVCSYTDELASELAYDFVTNVIAFNSLGLDVDNEDFDTYGTTQITFLVEAMEDMTQTEMNFIALHEMGHSFGLDDIYDEEFIGLTIMYGYASGQDELIPELRPFDLYNLYYIYFNEEDQVE